MPVSFQDTLVVGISSRALFDLEEENTLFNQQGIVEYRKLQREREDKILMPGAGFHVIKALLELNKLSKERLVEVIVMSRNSPETGIRVLNSLKHYKLDITRSAFTGGEPLFEYIEAFEIDLFLSKEENDVQRVIDRGSAAAALIYDPPKDFIPETSTVRIAFDADAVIFSDESEQRYKREGIEAFHNYEMENEQNPLKEGPHAKLLLMLSKIQHKMSTGVELSPLRLAIVTARNSPSHMRVINTLRNWDVYIDEAFFLGGLSKDKILKAFKAHIFFDDQDAHLSSACMLVPSARVPYKSSSPLYVQKKDLRIVSTIVGFNRIHTLNSASIIA
ncbi:MAG: 5'-nucleotidase, partial [Pedobacter sp.]